MLPRRSGTGSDMLPNEHLTLVHARLSGQRQATATMELVNRFESDRVNGKLPAALLRRRRHTPPSARQEARRSWRRAGRAARIVVAEMAKKLYPVQISVGVPSGANALVFGVRAMTAKRPDFAYVNIERLQPGAPRVDHGRVQQRPGAGRLSPLPVRVLLARRAHRHRRARRGLRFLRGRPTGRLGVLRGLRVRDARLRRRPRRGALAAGGFAQFQVDDGIAGKRRLPGASPGRRGRRAPRRDDSLRQVLGLAAWSPSLGVALARTRPTSRTASSSQARPRPRTGPGSSPSSTTAASSSPACLWSSPSTPRPSSRASRTR